MSFVPSLPAFGVLCLAFGALTVLFPLLAIGLRAASRARAPEFSDSSELSVDILVPAHNEQDTITRTLESVLNAATRLLCVYPQDKVRVTIALDGPKDDTRAVLGRYLEENRATRDKRVEIRVLDRQVNQGKWATIGELIETVALDWAALVDAGTIWPEDFLVRARPHLLDSRLAGVAPGYLPPGSRLERLVWWQERALKTLENGAGGPFSLHGASMLFRRPALLAAYNELKGRSWLNDDVVLGLMVRKRGEIRYLGADLAVSDCGLRENTKEMPRRQRMLQGNLEWISLLLPKVALEAPVVGLLALRRVARVFWAYFLAIMLVASILAVSSSLGLSLAALALSFVAGAVKRRLGSAALVSLASPIMIVRKSRKVQWT